MLNLHNCADGIAFARVSQASGLDDEKTTGRLGGQIQMRPTGPARIANGGDPRQDGLADPLFEPSTGRRTVQAVIDALLVRKTNQ